MRLVYFNPSLNVLNVLNRTLFIEVRIVVSTEKRRLIDGEELLFSLGYSIDQKVFFSSAIKKATNWCGNYALWIGGDSDGLGHIRINMRSFTVSAEKIGRKGTVRSFRDAKMWYFPSRDRPNQNPYEYVSSVSSSIQIRLASVVSLGSNFSSGRLSAQPF